MTAPLSDCIRNSPKQKKTKKNVPHHLTPLVHCAKLQPWRQWCPMKTKKAETMTHNQQQWAAQHDWFVRANPNGTVVVLERNTQAPNQEKTFVSYTALRVWAGY